MFSETEMFLSDQFLSTSWKCCCFWTPKSWCSPAQPHTGPSELAWTQVLLISFNWSISKVPAHHSTPCWSFSDPETPGTLVPWKGQLRDDKPMNMKWFFSVSLLFLGNRISWEAATLWPKSCTSSLWGRFAVPAGETLCSTVFLLALMGTRATLHIRYEIKSYTDLQSFHSLLKSYLGKNVLFHFYLGSG